MGRQVRAFATVAPVVRMVVRRVMSVRAILLRLFVIKIRLSLIRRVMVILASAQMAKEFVFRILAKTLISLTVQVL
ncbi:hypothetical protein D3C84_1240560 [compost metagenome]